ncbi:DUF2865 domain-containing protein [Nitratireductor luteus]|uniref:DUF2865 domain-containing protein n=1 Tax=Nitratireductor luteus TaxID=2976980 RepID=UPI00223E92C1|nr:DUF2865 domain-containing protein [Nitratireductor luteus]
MNIHTRIAYMVQVLTLAVACMATLTLESGAQSRTCRSLRAQLASLPAGVSSGQVAKFDSAIARQGVELRRARDNTQNARCGGLFASNLPQCGQLKATIAKMARNLADLQNKRRILASASGSKRERTRLLASLKANGCGNTRAISEPARKAAPKREQKAVARPNSAGSVYRTMCVRVGDGYYFPISFAVPKSMFDRDTEACQTRCPDTEVALYAYNVTAEESSAMVSVADGSPYIELETAYKYRQAKTRAPMCSNAPAQKKFTILAGEPDEQKVASIPIPTQRPDPEQQTDAETRADAAPATRDPSEIAPAAERKIRVVGPTFLPDQEEAINLRAPARTPARSAQP